MSYEQHIDRLLKEGFATIIGEHEGFPGYYVEVFKLDDYDQSIRPGIWDLYGHGFSIEEALDNAESIAKGAKPKKRYNSEDFEKEEEGKSEGTYRFIPTKEEKWATTEYGKWLHGFISPDVVKCIHDNVTYDNNIHMLCHDFKRTMKIIWELEKENKKLIEAREKRKNQMFAMMYGQRGRKEKMAYGQGEEESAAEFYTKVRERVLQKEKEKMVVWIRKEALHTISDRRAVVKEVNSDGFITIQLLEHDKGVTTVRVTDIIGVEIDETLTIKFRVSKYSIQETRCHNCGGEQ